MNDNLSPTPFTPENVLLGEDGRWYHDGVDVTDIRLGWSCAAGHHWEATLAERVGGNDSGCPACKSD